MITIVQRQSNQRTVQVTICDNPTLGSWGSLQLQMHEYRMQEDDEHWEQARFNMKYLRDKELDYGSLWCVYCGKEELRIYGFQERKIYRDMATVDHVIPISKAPHIAKDKKNLRVACWHCNNRKADKDWPERFPYD